MAKSISPIAENLRMEHYKNLVELPTRDLCEMVRQHFESHPALPGEKAMKDQVNQILAIMDDNDRKFAEEQQTFDDAQRAKTQQILASKFDPEATQRLLDEQKAETQRVLASKLTMVAATENLAEEDLVPVKHSPFDNDALLSDTEKDELALNFSNTRIRETPLKEGNYYLDFHNFDPTQLKRTLIEELPQENSNSTVYVSSVKAELTRNLASEVNVWAETEKGGKWHIGNLPDNFLHNNPMNVDSCEAVLQITDYSNGNMKNLSAKVVVDTDLMSGDVIDLDENMLNGLDRAQDDGLNQ